MSNEHIVMLFGITILFKVLATLKESLAVNSLSHKGLIIGTKCLARAYVAVLMADKTGLHSVPAL